MTDTVSFVFYREGEPRDSPGSERTPPVALEVLPPESVLAAAVRFPTDKRLPGEPVYMSLPDHLSPADAAGVVWLLDHRRNGVSWEMEVEKTVAAAMDYLCVPHRALKVAQLLRRAMFLWNVKRFRTVLRGLSNPLSSSILLVSLLLTSYGSVNLGFLYVLLHGAVWDPPELKCTLSCVRSGLVVCRDWDGTLKNAIPCAGMRMHFSHESGANASPKRLFIRGTQSKCGCVKACFDDVYFRVGSRQFYTSHNGIRVRDYVSKTTGISVKAAVEMALKAHPQPAAEQPVQVRFFMNGRNEWSYGTLTPEATVQVQAINTNFIVRGPTRGGLSAATI